MQLLLFISGLPESVLQRAAAKSREFETTYGKHLKTFEDNLYNQSWIGEMVEFVRKFIDITESFSCNKSPESTGASFLTELQHRAQILLQQSWTDWMYCFVRLGWPSFSRYDVNSELFIMIPHADFPVTVNCVEALFSYFRTSWGCKVNIQPCLTELAI